MNDFQESNKILENTEQNNKKSSLLENPKQLELDNTKDNIHMTLEETDPNQQQNL
ncbi:12851_t:CDS:2 [Cetraspora pellucida]|uniref:12851_t:CDS:1 n=1 Tax=Cetraspora pellucida TaxID=1433469 RepID=A0A9N9FJH5_9GLOM|nr:12851_t:CDS:2 [Cetraspora pellucida]